MNFIQLHFSEFEDDLSFYLRNFKKRIQVIPFGEYENNIEEIIVSIRTEKELLLTSDHEIFDNKSDYLLDRIIDEISKNKQNDVRISMATSSKIKYGLHPLVNLLHWQGLGIRESIENETENEFKIFNQVDYPIDLYNDDRECKGILSVRNQSYIRDSIFKKIDKSQFEGVLRYNRWSSTYNNYYKKSILYDYDGYINPVSTEQLRKEYFNSYVSFVMESTYGSIELKAPNQLTEKTVLSFLTCTMPILFGGKYFISELENMGFKVFNKEFGFKHGDLLDTNSMEKQNLFIETIGNYNKMSLEDIKKMYMDNIHHIKSNYEIIRTFVLGEFFNFKKNVI
jgi:hypothetical protein